MGKAIYRPSGKAGEFSNWACNLYVGCSNGCDYCYCKKGITAGTLGGDKPTLKKMLGGTEKSAYEIFKKELHRYKDEIDDLLFTFTSDPCLDDTIELNMKCTTWAIQKEIHCTILTKRAEFVDSGDFSLMLANTPEATKYLTTAFTLTGRDDREPYASPNLSRIDTMKRLHDMGFRTWASIEPIVDLNSSYDMIRRTCSFSDGYKIGLMSGKKDYTIDEVRSFKQRVEGIVDPAKIYWKTSLLEWIA